MSFMQGKKHECRIIIRIVAGRWNRQSQKIPLTFFTHVAAFILVFTGGLVAPLFVVQLLHKDVMNIPTSQGCCVTFWAEPYKNLGVQCFGTVGKPLVSSLT